MLKISYDNSITTCIEKPNDRKMYFKWDTGSLIIWESIWNKLSKKKKNYILDMGNKK